MPFRILKVFLSTEVGFYRQNNALSEKISEAYLIPVLEQIIDTFPFKVLGLHADNGSEYINQHVAKLL